VIPLGATVNLDGTVMASFIITPMAAMLVGYRPTFVDLLLLVIPIKLVTMGVPGIPGGIAVVVPPVVADVLPIPSEARSAFLALWFAFSVGLSDQFRTGVNTTTNGLVAIVFERLYPRWFEKRVAPAPAGEPQPEPATEA
jgi:Na+/H+-dicarboxylate symporter